MGNKNYTFLNGSIRSFLTLLVILSVSSCQKDPVREVISTDPGTPVTYTSGVFVINEGNFNWGNASVTFLDNSSDSVFDDIFGKMNNNKKLGDVAQEMKIQNGRGYIVVNNSNKIEVVSTTDFKSIATINGFNSPRAICLASNRKAYVTNLYKDISIVDLTTNTITKTIPTENWTESMTMYDSYLFVSAVGKYSDPNANRHAKILVIDTQSDEIIDSIKSGKEPLGMVIDKKNKVWVLCTGGYDGFEAPSLLCINPDLRMVEKTITLPKNQYSPSRLCINGTRDTLYFLFNGIYKLPVSEESLPANAFIPAQNKLFYGLDIDPVTGNIYATDAVDYVQDGWVYRFSQKNGAVIESFKAGRIPSSFCFSDASKK